MRLPALTMMFLAAFPAFAQEEPIQQTITSQFEALQADDFAAAFGLASPTIQGLFGTPENFGLMVQNGYPMVYRPSDVQMLDLREVAGALYQRVLVRDAEGRGFMLDYQMVETPDGWRINGVDLLPQPDVGA
jgi:Domain of unknown function (DUF4864)